MLNKFFTSFLWLSIFTGQFRFSTRAQWPCLLGLATALTTGYATTAGAAEAPRIAVVQTERILREAAPAKAAQTKLEQEFGKRDKELQDLGVKLKQASERLDRDSSVMAESERARRQREVADLDKEFQRRQREFREDLNQRRNEELSQVVERVNRVIRQIAEQEKFDLVLQEAVYFSPRIDLTDKVLRALSGAK
jgi:outer membrane protein